MGKKTETSALFRALVLGTTSASRTEKMKLQCLIILLRSGFRGYVTYLCLSENETELEATALHY